MAALTVRQQLAQQLAAFIWKRGGSVTNQLPLKNSDHIRFEARLCDDALVGDLKRLGLKLQLMALSTRVDPWAVTETLHVGNTQRLRRHSGLVNICVYEVELPEVAERGKRAT